MSLVLPTSSAQVVEKIAVVKQSLFEDFDVYVLGVD
jgi:hypothetical protein